MLISLAKMNKYKLSIPNIYTLLVMLFLIVCAIGLIYFDFFEKEVAAPPIALQIFIWIAYIFVGIMLVFIIRYFKIIVVYNYGIVCIYPFLFKKNEIKWDDLEITKTEVYFFAKTLVKSVTLNGKYAKISLSSFEYENFATLVKQIPDGDNVLAEINEKYYIFFKSKRRNIIEHTIFIFCNIGLAYYIFPLLDLCVFTLFFLVSLVLILASIKRIVQTINEYKICQLRMK